MRVECASHILLGSHAWYLIDLLVALFTAAHIWVERRVVFCFLLKNLISLPVLWIHGCLGVGKKQCSRRGHSIEHQVSFWLLHEVTVNVAVWGWVRDSYSLDAVQICCVWLEECLGLRIWWRFAAKLLQLLRINIPSAIGIFARRSDSVKQWLRLIRHSKVRKGGYLVVHINLAKLSAALTVDILWKIVTEVFLFGFCGCEACEFLFKLIEGLFEISLWPWYTLGWLILDFFRWNIETVAYFNSLWIKSVLAFSCNPSRIIGAGLWSWHFAWNARDWTSWFCALQMLSLNSTSLDYSCLIRSWFCLLNILFDVVLASPISKVNAWRVIHLIRDYIGPIRYQIGLFTVAKKV